MYIKYYSLNSVRQNILHPKVFTLDVSQEICSRSLIRDNKQLPRGLTLRLLYGDELTPRTRHFQLMASDEFYNSLFPHDEFTLCQVVGFPLANVFMTLNQVIVPPTPPVKSPLPQINILMCNSVVKCKQTRCYELYEI